jgi:hypothetical protein
LDASVIAKSISEAEPAAAGAPEGAAGCRLKIAYPAKPTIPSVISPIRRIHKFGLVKCSHVPNSHDRTSQTISNPIAAVMPLEILIGCS